MRFWVSRYIPSRTETPMNVIPHKWNKELCDVLTESSYPSVPCRRCVHSFFLSVDMIKGVPAFTVPCFVSEC